VSIHQSAMDLMKKIKSPDGYEPIPFTQIRWQMGEGQPLINRLWAILASKTLRKGFFSDFAVEIGRDGRRSDLYLENLAAELGIDEANARRAWRQGVELGYWRNGDPERGEPERRLYICGNVPSPKKGEQEANQKVCTDLLPGPILKQTKNWDPERVEKLARWWSLRMERRDTVLADLVDVARDIIAEDDDSALEREWELKPSRNKPHEPKAISLPHEAKQQITKIVQASREARSTRVNGLRAGIERLVQTSWEFVQSQEYGLYKALKNPAQTSATLLPETTPRPKLDSVSQTLEKGRQSNGKNHQGGSGSLPKQEYSPSAADSPPAKLTELELDFFAQLTTWKAEFRHADFGTEEISSENRGQLATVRKILLEAKFEREFFRFVTEKLGKLRPAMGKRAGEATPEGRTLGLILTWAEEFTREAPGRAKREKEKKEAFERAAANSKALQKDLDRQAIQQAMETLKHPNATDQDRQLARELLALHGISTAAAIEKAEEGAHA